MVGAHIVQPAAAASSASRRIGRSPVLEHCQGSLSAPMQPFPGLRTAAAAWCSTPQSVNFAASRRSWPGLCDARRRCALRAGAAGPCPHVLVRCPPRVSGLGLHNSAFTTRCADCDACRRSRRTLLPCACCRQRPVLNWGPVPRRWGPRFIPTAPLHKPNTWRLSRARLPVAWSPPPRSQQIQRARRT